LSRSFRARLRPVLEARAQALERVLAADAAVAAVVAEIGHTGLVPLPACPCAPVLGGAQAAVAGAAEWLDPPPPAGLPADHVLVRCVRPFRVLPSGEVDQIPQNIGLIGAAGAPILPLESCAVTARAAAVLIERGFATRIPAAG
jgi:hypothetical protein